MDIQSLSVNMSQMQLQEQAAASVQSMAMDTAKEQGAALEKLMSSAQVMSDPALGNNLNLLA
jgi:hypothetical protein